MRVVDVNEFYSPTGGGVRTYVDRKMGIMADMGHELIVVAPGKEDRVEERPGGGRIIYLKSPGMAFDRNYGLFWDERAIHTCSTISIRTWSNAARRGGRRGSSATGRGGR